MNFLICCFVVLKNVDVVFCWPSISVILTETGCAPSFSAMPH